MDQTILPSPALSIIEHVPTRSNNFHQYEYTEPRSRCVSMVVGVVRHSPQSKSRHHSPDLPDATSQLGLMEYTHPHQGVPFTYTTLRPNEDAGSYQIVHAVPAAQTYRLNTPEASPRVSSNQLPNEPNTHRASTTRATREMKTLAVKSGRIEKTPPKKKAPLASSPLITRKDKTAKVNSGDTQSLDQPLSILTQDWDVPSVDIEAYVHRSIEERRQEVDRGKVPGKVKRAMNAFMLYRKAYQDKAKKWAQQSNHQVVSKICGQSWSIEPEAVRSQFNEWAVTERDNHRKAHPEYKFTPSKPRKKGRDDVDDDSDLDDPEWAGSSRLGSKRRSTSRPLLDEGYRPPRAPYAHSYSTSLTEMQPLQALHHGPSSHFANLTRHTTAPYEPDDFVTGGASYQPLQLDHQHQMEGLGFSNPQIMGLSNAQNLPNHQNFELGNQYPPPGVAQHPLGLATSHNMNLGQQIDPSLATRDGMPHYDMSGPVLAAGNLDESQWQTGLPPVGTDNPDVYPGPYFAEVDEAFMQDAQLQYLRGDDESWKVGPVNETDDWHL